MKVKNAKAFFSFYKQKLENMSTKRGKNGGRMKKRKKKQTNTQESQIKVKTDRTKKINKLRIIMKIKNTKNTRIVLERNSCKIFEQKRKRNENKSMKNNNAKVVL